MNLLVNRIMQLTYGYCSSDCMWLIVCTADRRYSVVNEKNVAKGNVSCGSRITVELGETKKDVTVIFMGKNRTQCDQYCQRLSKYCGVVDGKKPPVDPTLPNLPKRRKKSLEEPPSESSAVQTESLSEDPKKELVEPVDDGAKDNAAKSDDITIVSDTATHGEEIPSTSTEQAQEDNEGTSARNSCQNSLGVVIREMRVLIATKHPVTAYM